MAGNENSGNGLPFRLSEDQLKERINEFKNEYGSGKHGIVTWDRFCAFLGYSAEDVRECYLYGSGGKNAYTGRAAILRKFATECRAMMIETADKKMQIARDLYKVDPLAPPEQIGDGKTTLQILFGGGDGRWMEAIK